MAFCFVFEIYCLDDSYPLMDVYLKVINHQPYNEKVDIFSFAIVLWELTTSKVHCENDI